MGGGLVLVLGDRAGNQVCRRDKGRQRGGRGGLVLVLPVDRAGNQVCRRDKGRQRGGHGGLVLVLPGDRAGNKDKHKAPASASPRPLSLQNRCRSSLTGR